MNDSIPPMRRCTKCQQEFPATNEYYQPRESGKLRKDCRTCQREYQHRYYDENHDTLLAKKRGDYYARHEYHLERAARGRKKYAQQNLRWRESHRQELRDYTKRWHTDHPDRPKQWRKKHPNKVREIKARYRSRKVQAWGEYTDSDIERLYAKQEGRCLYCDKPLSRSFHVDHFTPLSKAGWNAPDNLALACHSCNTSKGDTLPYRWYAWNGRFPVEWEGRLL